MANNIIMDGVVRGFGDGQMLSRFQNFLNLNVTLRKPISLVPLLCALLLFHPQHHHDTTPQNPPQNLPHERQDLEKCAIGEWWGLRGRIDLSTYASTNATIHTGST